MKGWHKSLTGQDELKRSLRVLIEVGLNCGGDYSLFISTYKDGCKALLFVSTFKTREEAIAFAERI